MRGYFFKSKNTAFPMSLESDTNENELLVFVGPSGSGKTTIATKIAEEEHAVIVSLGKIIEQYAKKEGLTLKEYFDRYGVEKGFANVRLITLKKIVATLRSRRVIIEGVYDRKLLDAIFKKIGREKVIIIRVSGSRHVRRRRLEMRTNFDRKTAVKHLRIRDAVKWAGGLQEVLKTADFNIRANTVSDAVQQYHKKCRRL